MKYVYHFLPSDMQGDILYPLNTLKDKFPELYQSKASKYDNRKYLMEVVIPILNVKWNSVLHLSSLNPELVWDYLATLGIKPKRVPYLKIPVSTLDENKTIIYKYSKYKKGTVFIPKEEYEQEYEKFSQSDYHELTDLTTIQKEYFKEALQAGKKPLFYVGVPHIMTTEHLDIKLFELVNLK